MPAPPLITCKAPVVVLVAAVELLTVNTAPDKNDPAVVANPTCMLPVLVYVGALVPALTNSCPAVPGPTNPVTPGAL